jgi:hypothetical protein
VLGATGIGAGKMALRAYKDEPSAAGADYDLAMATLALAADVELT